MLEFGIFWIITAVFTYGFAFGHLQREWPDVAVKLYYKDMEAAITMAFFGPIGLLVLVCTGSMKHGLKFW